MSGLKSITFFYIVTTLRMFRNSFFDKVAKKLVNGTWVVQVSVLMGNVVVRVAAGGERGECVVAADQTLHASTQRALMYA